MIQFIGSLFGFVNDCLVSSVYPGLNMSMATFVYGFIVICISITVIARLLMLHDQYDDTQWHTFETKSETERRRWGNTTSYHTVTSRRRLK